MAATTEEQKKQAEKKAKAAADKAGFLELAKFHEKESRRYFQKADDCDQFELAHRPPAENFLGL
jgi:hypothetical protein